MDYEAEDGGTWPAWAFVGERVGLRPVQGFDILKLVEWDADDEISGWAGKKFERAEDATDWYLGAHPLKRRSYVIEISTPRRIIGEIELVNVSWRLHMGEMRVFIGEKGLWGQGLGTDAVRTFVKGMFERTALREIFLRVDSENERARRCYAKVGFRAQGTVTVRCPGGGSQSLILMRIRKGDLS